MFHCLSNSAWADGNLAEAAGQLGKMVEHPLFKFNPTQIHEQMGHPVDPSFPVYDEHGVHVVDEVGEAKTHVVADERAPLYHHF